LKEKHMMKRFQPDASTSEEDMVPLVLPLAALDRSKLSLGGGKAANLGELIQAGLRVPAGFCITTAAYERVATQAALDSSLAGLEAVSHEDRAERLELATAMRTALCQTPVPSDVVEAITSAYQALAGGEPVPVAVRSSATAEDLSGTSFAGQQETMLNVIGIEALLTAVQRCFASLWTDRAVQYRASLGIDPRSVRLEHRSSHTNLGTECSSPTLLELERYESFFMLFRFLLFCRRARTPP
jgi:rifampicin phosphotransferase